MKFTNFRLKVAQLKNKNRIDPSHGAKFWNDAIKGGIDKESGPMDMVQALHQEKRKFRTAQKDLENTGTELNETFFKSKMKDAEIENLKQIIDGIKQENKNLKARVDELEDQNTELSQEKSVLLKRVNKLHNSVKTKSFEKLHQKISDYQQEISDLKAESQTKSKQIGGLKRAVQAVQEAAQRHSIELTETPKKLYEVRKTIQSDIVQISQENITPLSCYVGQVYRSSSVGSIYVEEAIGVIKSPNNQTYLALSQKTKDKRIQQVEYMISKLCGGDKCSLDYEEFMK